MRSASTQWPGNADSVRRPTSAPSFAGVPVYQQTFILDGDELGIDTIPNVKGHSVTLIFEGHDSPDCGGISELRVIGA